MRRNECENLQVKPPNRLPAPHVGKAIFTKHSQPIHSSKEAWNAIDKDLSREQSHLQFLANMNHELRTPINGLMGAAELLSLTELNAEQKQYVEIFRSANQHLLDLVESILDFSKMMNGELKLQKNHFDIRQLIHDCYDHFKPFAEKKGLSLKVTIADDGPRWLYGDAKRLSQILYHLVANAIKFTHQGGISIELGCEETKVLLVVRDSGIGIAKASQDSIFEAFFQVDGSFTRQYGGVGMGLAVSQFLVKAMGGELMLSSDLGKGSEFALRFPNLINKEAAVDDEVTAYHRQARILLVEDDEINQALVFLLFSKRGLHIDIAQDGLEALNAHRKNPYDLIFMDLQMPVMGGIEATRQIRAIDSKVHIIALTATLCPDDIQLGIKAGMNDFLSKPLNYLSLERLLDQAGNRLKS